MIVGLGGPLDVVMGKPDGWAAAKGDEITNKLDDVERLLWIAAGASVLTAVAAVLFPNLAARLRG